MPSRQTPVAVIDLGSNTALLLVCGPSGQLLLEASRITRIGKGVFETGRLDPERKAETRDAVVEFAKQARALGAVPLVAVATEALRRTSEGPAFLAALCETAKLDRAWILTGEEEARYTIEASRRAAEIDSKPLLVADVGGGSTELAWLEGERVRGVSLPLGTVRLTEARVHTDPPQASELARVAAECDRVLAESREIPGPAPWQAVALAGTATTLAALDQALLEYAPERVEGYQFSLSGLRSWTERLASLPLLERQALPGMERGRADVILAGLVIIERVWARLGVDQFSISGRGVRHGVAMALQAETPLVDADGPL